MGLLSFLTGGAKGSEEKPDYYEEGLSLAREERYHEALTSLRLSLRERPGDTAVLEQMGVVYTRMGMSEDAIKMYQRALEKSPDSPAAHYGLGFLHLSRGDLLEADTHLDRFLGSPAGSAGAVHVRHAQETLARLRARSGEPEMVGAPESPESAPLGEDLELGI